MRLRSFGWLLLAVLGLCLLASSPPDERETPSRGFSTRAVWVTRWAFKSPEDVTTLFERLADIGVNTIFFQVRGACDAFYRSSYEPWSSVLTGTLGKDPGWDPLRLAIREAHKHGQQLHAWVNVFTAWPVTEAGEEPPVTNPAHVMLAHPEWIACDRSERRMQIKQGDSKDNYAFLSPTSTEARRHIQNVVNEIAGKYDVDGIHLDYVRFPDSSYSYDKESRLAYLKATMRDVMSFSQWRREQLTEFVGQLSRSIKRVRPGTAVSAAVWQVIDSGRTSYYQDGVDWVRKGYVDFLVPMIYTTSPGMFESRLGAYADSVGASRIVAGIGAYMEGFADTTLDAELTTAEAYHARGVCIFNSDYALLYPAILSSFFTRSPDNQ
jgi:uncharacterized lipoprotein YddW (UPF0748 family)